MDSGGGNVLIDMIGNIYTSWYSREIGKPHLLSSILPALVPHVITVDQIFLYINVTDNHYAGIDIFETILDTTELSLHKEPF